MRDTVCKSEKGSPFISYDRGQSTVSETLQVSGDTEAIL